MPRILAWPLAALAIIALPVSALSAPAGTTDNPFRHTMALDQRLQDTGWRIARANAAYCSDVTPSIGLLLQDMQSWAYPEKAHAALGVPGDTHVVVGAAANGSPSHEAGLITGTPLRAIAGIAMDGTLPSAAAGTFERQAQLHDTIDRALTRDGAVVVVTGGPDAATSRIAATPICTSRFEIVTEGDLAEANGKRVLISADLALELADDDQFAFVVAHELAHNILRHKERLDATGRKKRHLRATEREADRLAIWLMDNAGYDPGGAARFASGWLRSRGNGLFNPSHDGWDERLEGIEAEIALLGASAAQVGGYDWSTRFPQRGTAAKSEL